MANNNKIGDAIKKAAEEKEKALKKEKEAVPIITPSSEAIPLPAYETGLAQEKIKVGIDHKIVAYYDTKNPISEQFRALRTHIYSAEVGGNCNIIAVTSSSYQEGKTIVAVNLSVVIAQDSQKPILLIDCNLRKPSVDIFLGLHTDKGLSDVLAGDARISDVLTNTDINNLTVLPAGQVPINPADLGSQKMKDLLTELKAQYDRIILDTPPVIPYADPRILGPLVDGVVMVVRVGKTRREAVSRAEDTLKKVGAKVLGYVLTGIEYYIPEYIHRHL